MAVDLSKTGGSSSIKINAGEVNNQGIEIMLKTKPVITKRYQWDLSLSFSKQKDKILKLYPGILETNRTERGTDIVNRSAEGQPMGELWMRDYLRDENGNKIVNANGLYQVTSSSELIRVGNINPDFFGGLNSNFSVNGKWGAVNMSFGIDYRVGGSIISLTNYYLKGNGLIKSSLPYRDTEHGGLTYTDSQGRVRHDGLILPGVKADGSANDIIVSAYDYYSTYRHTTGGNFQPDEIKENNYVKFREIALGYTFPQRLTQKMKIQRLSLSLTARNLFYIYKSIDNIDPESTLGTNSWTEYSNYPSSRTYGFNVNIAF
jgi:iron complex outermembrane receptor protein